MFVVTRSHSTPSTCAWRKVPAKFDLVPLHHFVEVRAKFPTPSNAQVSFLWPSDSALILNRES